MGDKKSNKPSASDKTWRSTPEPQSPAADACRWGLSKAGEAGELQTVVETEGRSSRSLGPREEITEGVWGRKPFMYLLWIE